VGNTVIQTGKPIIQQVLMKRTVLILEDTPDIAELVRMHLEDLDCTVLVEPRGDTGLARFREGGIDLVILDLMLPGLDGLSVCREIRTLPGYTPVLMLTARSSELDRVLGLEMGADDYLTKPFSVAELTARVKALFRRVDALSQPAVKPDNKILICDQLRLDPSKRRVWIADAEVELTAREFELLFHFASHPGQVFSRLQLLDSVWGYNHEGYEHTVNTHINRLRGKIEKDLNNPHYIQTVWGVGYRFRE
jgi:DNA-binding response OmpR family regulator